MTKDWLLRVADGGNLIRSSRWKTWGILSKPNWGKHFIDNVKPGDRLWFIKSKSQGQVIAVAIYQSHNRREDGPLINVTLTNEELGWTREGTDWKASDTEIHYTDLYNISACELKTRIKGAATIRGYNDKCLVNLPKYYAIFVKTIAKLH